MSDNIFLFEGEDPTMLAAMQQARDTFKYFWRELSWEYRRIVPAFDMIVIKAGFETGVEECSVEHMWVSDIEFDGVKIEGVLMNQPRWVQDMNEGDKVSITMNELEDWMISMNGEVYGAFTVQAMRSNMDPKERKGHDEAWGLNFGSFEKPRIYISGNDRNTKKQGFISSLFGKKNKAETHDEPEIEHQMSINMMPKIYEAIKSDPEAALGADEDGWTMLHREALAGNCGPVKALKENGADVMALNCNGHTALDLAKIMDWPEIIKVLDGQLN